MKKVKITDNMRELAKTEASRRDAHIKHHFEVGHLSYSERDEIGFLGEFACCQFLGIKRPDGGNYPFPGSPVRTSALKPITDFL